MFMKSENQKYIIIVLGHLKLHEPSNYIIPSIVVKIKITNPSATDRA